MEKKQNQYKAALPMGNLFEKREVKRDPIAMREALATGLKAQVKTMCRIIDYIFLAPCAY